jgi:hypothetical protein
MVASERLNGMPALRGGLPRGGQLALALGAPMSDDGVAAILRRLDAMERERAEDMVAIGARIDILTEAHKRCVARCWVGSQEQIRKADTENLRELLLALRDRHPDLAPAVEAMDRALRDTGTLPAVPEAKP